MTERLHRATVVNRAAELADTIGLDELTITRLGRALGIAPPGVYRHVADLEDLRRAIGQKATRDVAVVLASACAGLSGHDALSAIAHALRDWSAKHPAQYTALQIAPDHDDESSVAAADELMDVIASALRAYRLSGDDLTDAIRLIRSTLHGFIELELGEGFKENRATGATFERIVGALDTVLIAWLS